MRFFAAPLLIFVTAAIALAAPIVESAQHDGLDPAHIGVRDYIPADGEDKSPDGSTEHPTEINTAPLFINWNTRPIESANRIANRPIQESQSVSANAYQIGGAPSPGVLDAGTSAQATRRGRGRASESIHLIKVAS